MAKSNKILEVIATSDIHGAFYPCDIVSAKQNSASMAQLSTYINRQKQRNDRDLLILDNGDFLQGSPLSYYYNYIDTKSKHIAAEVFNYLNYDMVAVGNHDLEGGQKVYDRFNADLNCGFYSANIYNTITQKPYFKPYKIFTKVNKKIAVLAITTPGIPNWIPDHLIANMYFEDMIISAQHWITEIKEKEQPDFIIGLFHSGMDYNYNGQNAQTKNNENATALVAYNIDGFDVIICGHDHQGHNLKIINKFGKEVTIIAPSSHAKDFCSIEINWQQNKYKNIKSRLYDMKSLKQDKNFISKFEPYYKKVLEHYNEPIGKINAPILQLDSLFMPSPYINLIHQLQLYVTKAEISLAAPLSITELINKGIIYKKDLFKLYKFDNFLYTIKMTGQEIKDLLEFSYWHWFNKMSSETDYLLRYKLNERNELSSDFFPNTFTPYYNYESAYGIDYIVDVSKPYKERIIIKRMSNGNAFDINNIYKVALNSYRSSGGGQHFTNGLKLSKNEINKRIEYASTKEVKEYFYQYFKEKDIIEISATKNWHIQPGDWYYNRIKEEEKLFKTNN